MAQQGATLQNNNNELVKCIEGLKNKHADLTAEIVGEEQERAVIQGDIHTLNKRLAQLQASAQQRRAIRDEYDRCIAESEGTYTKIVSMAETLLTFAKKEASNLRAKEAQAPRQQPTPVVSTLENGLSLDAKWEGAYQFRVRGAASKATPILDNGFSDAKIRDMKLA